MSSTSRKWETFIPNAVFAVIDDQANASRAVTALVEAGFSEDRVTVWRGEEGKKEIDPTGKEHGVIGRIRRAVQTMGTEYDVIQEFAELVGQGKSGFAVGYANQDELASAHRILAEHAGREMACTSQWMWTRLGKPGADKPTS